MNTLESGGTIGIVDEGQLGRMITEAAVTYGYHVRALGSKGADSPAGRVGAIPVVGRTGDAGALWNLAGGVDVITLDSEHGVNASELVRIEESGTYVSPSGKDLAISQDKWVQKAFMRQIGVPTAPSMLLRHADDLEEARDRFGQDLIAKARIGAYDGRGNRNVTEDMIWIDVEQSFTDLKTGRRPDLYIEQRLPFMRELAVVGAKGKRTNDIALYPTVETRQTDHICDVVIASPDLIDAEIDLNAKDIAHTITRNIRNAGMVAVEMFQVGDRVIANEFALRVHNSGHWTDFGAETSQFDQNVRAICGMELGSTAMKAPAVVMKNILGIHLLDRVPSLDGIRFSSNIHPRLYDKTPAPARKIGHITVLANTVDDALDQAENAHAKLLKQL
jgi:5-(carboxyamino)imidazole ribonucleotide synthase